MNRCWKLSVADPYQGNANQKNAGDLKKGWTCNIRGGEDNAPIASVLLNISQNSIADEFLCWVNLNKRQKSSTGF
jgi:hypothetical protein